MKRLLVRPGSASAVLALVLWIASWWPSLLPRASVMQGIISGVCAAIGWMLGAAVTQVGRGLFGLTLPAGTRRAASGLAVALALIGTVIAVIVWRHWQNEQRAVMGMPSLGLLVGVGALVVSALVLAVLVAIGRVVARGVRWIDRQVARLIVPTWGRFVTAAIVIVIVVFGWRAGNERFVSWADTSFGVVNAGTPYGIAPPDAATVSGSPASAAEWDTLGRQGRGFVGDAPTAAEIAAFTGAESALDPIRVYAGLDSAKALDDRIELVLAELERTGAFERQVLVVATATGTGWINPDAARTIEFMYGGDTAIVSVQYSFLPSWVAFVIDPTVAGDAGAALFDTVHERWSALPERQRPLLVAFGESLGSFGGEAAFDTDDTGDLGGSFAALAERADAALFVGPTTYNTMFTGLVAERDADSPSWRPVRDDLPQVRVANDHGEVVALTDGDDGASWSSPRALYLFHPTDGVGVWSMSTLWSPPEWVDRPLGVGIGSQARWFPIVTWVHETADLMAGFSAVPGFGHDYRNEFVAAWAAVVPPDGWTSDDTSRLERYLDLQ